MSNTNEIKNGLNQEDLRPIIEQIDKFYEGNVLILTEWLDRAIYMLHFIPCDGEFTELQRQNVCGVLLGVKESLMEAYFEKQGWSYEKFD
ncbi:MAG: hypothetical protein EP338_01615 [Bacteroidetes bacterium]|nr:MAG: hypothetical protein EP338_01615 [Bacteroidota bacterium]